MSMSVSFKENVTPQEKADAKASAKASLVGTAITAAGGAIVGGVAGTLAGFLPCKPSVDKVIEGMHAQGDGLAKDYFDKIKTFNEEAVKENVSKEKLAELGKDIEKARDVVSQKAADLIKNSPDSDLIKNAKKVTKSMLRPNRIAKGVMLGTMAALLLNIISSYRKPKSQDVNEKSFQA